MRIDVAVVDDHDLVAEGLIRLIERSPSVRVVGRFRSGEQLLRGLSEGLTADVCLVDLSMPGMGGAATIREVSSRRSAPACIALTASASPEVAANVLASGGNGFLTKAQSATVLFEAIETCAAGGTYVDPVLREKVGAALLDQAPRLSEREFEVMRRLAKGERISGIAADLYVSPKTVSTHRRRILDKLGLSSNAELAVYALDRGIVER